MGQIIELLNTLRKTGHVFGLTFQKADGTVRKAAGRLGVFHPPQGPQVQGVVDRRAEDEAAGCLTFYDFNAERKDNVRKGSFRRLRFDRLIEVRYRGQVYRP